MVVVDWPLLIAAAVLCWIFGLALGLLSLSDAGVLRIYQLEKILRLWPFTSDSRPIAKVRRAGAAVGLLAIALICTLLAILGLVSG